MRISVTLKPKQKPSIHTINFYITIMCLVRYTAALKSHAKKNSTITVVIIVYHHVAELTDGDYSILFLHIQLFSSANTYVCLCSND